MRSAPLGSRSTLLFCLGGKLGLPVLTLTGVQLLVPLVILLFIIS